MKREILFQALRSKFDASQAEVIVEEIASLEDQNIERLKEVFATKDDLHRELRVLYSDLSTKIDSKIDKLSENTDSKINKLSESVDSKIDKLSESVDSKIGKLSEKLDTKIDRMYWFMLGQTAVMVGLILAILRTAGVF